MDDIEDAVDAGTFPVVPQPVTDTFHIQFLGRQIIVDVVAAVTGEGELAGHDAVAYPHGLEGTLWNHRHAQHALLVFRVHQHRCQRRVGAPLPVVETEEKHIQQQLRKVAVGHTGEDEVVVGKRAVARFLLHEEVVVHLQEVHTSLDAEHLGEERRLNDTLPGVEVADLAWQCLADGFMDMCGLPRRLVMEVPTGFSLRREHA